MKGRGEMASVASSAGVATDAILEGEKRAPSNSPLGVKKSTSAHLSLDRLSFVGDLDLKKDRAGQLTSQAWENWLHDFGVKGRRFTKFPYHYLIETVAGYRVETKAVNAHIPDVRVDFNPNQCCGWRDSLPKLIGAMKRPRITRLDFAIDYRLDLSEWAFITQRPVKSCRYYSAAGKLETLYLGATRSAIRFRIYNKAEESGSVGVWWRVEAQCRFEPDDNPLHCHPFALLSVSRPGEGLDIEEKALLFYLQNFPDALGELSKYKRKRVKALLRSDNCIHLSPSPRQAFEDQAGAILSVLRQVFHKEKKS